MGIVVSLARALWSSGRPMLVLVVAGRREKEAVMSFEV